MATERSKKPTYTQEDLRDVLTVAVQLYEAEKKRGEIIERKGTYLIGFGGIVISLGTFAIGNLHTLNLVALILLVPSIVTMAISVYCGIRVVRTGMYQTPDMTSVTGNSTVDGLFREYTDDIIAAYKDHVEKSRTSGGWLQAGERWLASSIALLAVSLLLAISPPLFTLLCTQLQSWVD